MKTVKWSTQRSCTAYIIEAFVDQYTSYSISSFHCCKAVEEAPDLSGRNETMTDLYLIFVKKKKREENS